MILEPDREQIEQFVNVMFRHVAGTEGYISVRSYIENDTKDDRFPFRITPVRLNGKGLQFLIDVAVDDARRAAQDPKLVVFCPPMAVFSKKDRAREVDLTRGLALSAEIDENPREGVAKLEAIIGPATVVVKSGGFWTDSATGEIQNRLHAHWRLANPACDKDSLARLKDARGLAAFIAGGDPSNKSIVHPIRWPGSWHRKANPQLCEIETLNPDVEIDLEAALQGLHLAAPAPKPKESGHDHTSNSKDWSELIAPILDGSSLHPSLVPLTMKLLRAGMGDGAVVNATWALMDQSRAKVDDHLRWLARYNEVPGMVSSGREKIEEENARGEQIPLFPELPPGERFPIESLGFLSRAAAAIASKVQVPEAIAAQSVLATAALVTQAHANVLLPYGQHRPLSLYFVTVAYSGDRKTTADLEALWPIAKHEKNLREAHEHEMRGWKVDHSAWLAEKRKIENGKGDLESRRRRLGALGDEPLPPLHPVLTIPDPTIEGLFKAWPNSPAAMGIYTAEGGQFVGGHGMRNEQILKTGAAYSDMWDGRPIKRVRALDGVSIMHGRRLSLHLMVQPDAAAGFLANPILRDQGFLSRILVAAPDSIAGTRLYRDTDPGVDLAIRAYGARILSVVEARWPLRDSRNELEPRSLVLSAGAIGAWRDFFNEGEGELGPNGRYHMVRDFGAKTAEHAARIAGVMTLVDDIYAQEISEATMISAITLTRWYLAEAVRLQQGARTDPKLLVADAVLKFLQSRTEREIRVRELMQYGPSTVRTKAAAQEALETLQSHGWVVKVCKRPYTVRLL